MRVDNNALLTIALVLIIIICAFILAGEIHL